jgi:hypothetical protein
VRQTSYITYKLHGHTLDNVEASKWLDGSQTVLAYSTVGLAIAVYAADFTGFVQF